MMIPSAQSIPLIAVFEQLGPHDHLCSIDESQQEHLAVGRYTQRRKLCIDEHCSGYR